MTDLLPLPADPFTRAAAASVLAATAVSAAALFLCRTWGRGRPPVRCAIAVWGAGVSALAPLAALLPAPAAPPSTRPLPAVESLAANIALPSMPAPPAAAEPPKPLRKPNSVRRAAPIAPAPVIVDWGGAATSPLMPEAESATPPLPIGETAPTGPSPTLIIAAAVWVAGVLALLIRLLVGLRRTAALLRSARPGEEQVPAAALAAARAAMGGHLPPIRIAEGIPGPVAAGLFRPVILLPTGLPERLSAEAMRDVLIHEAAHCRRRDPLGGLVQRLAAAVCWPHPLVHLLNRQADTAREEICDNHVLAAGDRVGYARLLLELSSHPSEGEPPLPAAALLARRGRLEDRITGILDNRRNLMTRVNRGLLWLAAGSVAAAGTVAALLVPAAPVAADPARPSAVRPPAAAPAPAPADAEVYAKLDERVAELKLPGVPFEESVQFVRDRWGVSIWVNWTSVEAAGIAKASVIDMTLKNPTLRTVLERMFETLSPGTDAGSQLAYVVRDGTLDIATVAQFSSRVSTVVYPVRDLVGPRTDAGHEQAMKQLIDIVKGVSPTTFADGAEAPGALWPLNGNLVVRQSPLVHEHIRGLLAQLRKAAASGN